MLVYTSKHSCIYPHPTHNTHTTTHYTTITHSTHTTTHYTITTHNTHTTITHAHQDSTLSSPHIKQYRTATVKFKKWRPIARQRCHSTCALQQVNLRKLCQDLLKYGMLSCSANVFMPLTNNHHHHTPLYL